jgi:hypothetical protein
MRRLFAGALLAAFATFACAQVDPKTLQGGPETRWFNLDRTSTGYIAAGNLAGTFWAFHVRGQEMKRLAVTTFSLDGVILQVRAIPRSVVKGGTGMNPLGAHKAYEQRHLSEETPGSTFRDHDFCREAKVPHEQWISQAPGGISEAFVTFLVGDYVLMVASPYENDVRERAVERAVGEACSTLRLEKARADAKP